MTYKKILPLNSTQSLIAIKGDNGSLKFGISYKFEDQIGKKYPCNHTFDSLGGAIKHAATKCFKPMHRYVVIETGKKETCHTTYRVAETELKNRIAAGYVTQNPNIIIKEFLDEYKRKTVQVMSGNKLIAELKILDIIC